jgi:hypothetical protein
MCNPPYECFQTPFAPARALLVHFGLVTSQALNTTETGEAVAAVKAHKQCPGFFARIAYCPLAPNFGRKRARQQKR